MIANETEPTEWCPPVEMSRCGSEEASEAGPNVEGERPAALRGVESVHTVQLEHHARRIEPYTCTGAAQDGADRGRLWRERARPERAGVAEEEGFDRQRAVLRGASKGADDRK